MNDDLLNRYSRHILLDEIGIDGQKALLKARVAVIGAGGLGSPAALYLAAAGVGELNIYDDDKVDLTNLQRQILHTTERIGQSKVNSAQTALHAINPHCKVTPIDERINEDNAESIISNVCAVVDGSDNYETRHLLNRVCVRLQKPLIFGAASGFDGQVAVFDSRRQDSPCYHCLFAETDSAEDTPCALMGVFAPLAGIVGCLLASETLKVLAMPKTSSLLGRLLLIDARSMRLRTVRVAKDPDCAVCKAT